MIKLRKKQKGFTLVELLIVIAIIAVLAAVVTPVAISAIDKSKATAVYAEIKSIETAQLTYFVEEGTYTNNFTDLEISGLNTNESGVNSSNAEYTLSDASGEGVTLGIDGHSSFTAELEGLLGTPTSGSTYKISEDFTVVLD